MIKDLNPLQEETRFNPRWKFVSIYILLLIIVAFLGIKLFELQIVEGGENAYISSLSKTSESIIRAPRGIIYDRNGNPLVINKPTFRVGISTNSFDNENKDQTIKLLAQILNLNELEVSKKYEEELNQENGIVPEEITISREATRDQVLALYSNINSLKGVFIEVDAQREYKFSEDFSHILGYVGEVTAEDLQNEQYSLGDTIGKSGLEQYYDQELRGINGKKYTQLASRTESKEIDQISAKEGNNLYISIDTEAQQKMIELMKAKMAKYNSPGGAAIIEDVETGEIIVLASLPSFDANSLVRGLTLDEFDALYNNPDLPLYNRTVSGAYPPGSTHKTIVASAALQENIITKDTIFQSTGCMDLGGGYKFCEAGKRSLGQLNLITGIALSSNIYFCNTALPLGIDKMYEYDKLFGLEQPTGIDLPQEASGTLSSKDYKMQVYNEIWYPGDTCNAAIGQGLTTTTPIQMTNWIAAIANGGKLLTPHIGMRLTNSDNQTLKEINPGIKSELPINDEYLADIREGMHQVVNDPWGSAWILRGSKSDASAKTGSAEAYRKVGDSYEIFAHAWVTGFFPYNNPKYSFTVFLEYGGWGYESAEVIKEFLDWYINTRGIPNL